MKWNENKNPPDYKFIVVKDILVEKGSLWIDWIHSFYVEIMVKSLTGMLELTYRKMP